MKLSKFITKINLEKYPNITLFGDEFECTDCGDIVKGGVIKNKILNEHADEEVTDKTTELRIGVTGLYAIHLKEDE